MLFLFFTGDSTPLPRLCFIVNALVTSRLSQNLKNSIIRFIMSFSMHTCKTDVLQEFDMVSFFSQDALLIFHGNQYAFRTVYVLLSTRDMRTQIIPRNRKPFFFFGEDLFRHVNRKVFFLLRVIIVCTDLFEKVQWISDIKAPKYFLGFPARF